MFMERRIDRHRIYCIVCISELGGFLHGMTGRHRGRGDSVLRGCGGRGGCAGWRGSHSGGGRGHEKGGQEVTVWTANRGYTEGGSVGSGSPGNSGGHEAAVGGTAGRIYIYIAKH